MWQIRKSERGDPRDEVGPTETEASHLEEDRHTELKVALHHKLIDLINLSALDMSRAQVEAEVGEIVHEQLALQKHALNLEERRRLVSDILDELLGLGPLEPLLKDHSITDILVNGHKVVFVERNGQTGRNAHPVQG